MEPRKTYESKNASYNLNPEKVFDIVADLYTYIDCAVGQAERENHSDYVTPAVSFMGFGKKLVISAEVSDFPSGLSSFVLAELVIDKDKLTFTTHGHPKVAIPSNDLEFIAREYKMK